MARRGFSLKNSKLITKLLVLVYHIIFQVLEMIKHKNGILEHPTDGPQKGLRAPQSSAGARTISAYCLDLLVLKKKKDSSLNKYSIFFLS